MMCRVALLMRRVALMALVSSGSRHGLVTETAPAPGATDPQGQRQYTLTEAGRREVDEWFSTPRARPAPDRDELVIKLTLAASLEDVDVDAVIDVQWVATTEELQRYTHLKAANEVTGRFILRSRTVGGCIQGAEEVEQGRPGCGTITPCSTTLGSSAATSKRVRPSTMRCWPRSGRDG